MTRPRPIYAGPGLIDVPAEMLLEVWRQPHNVSNVVFTGNKLKGTPRMTQHLAIPPQPFFDALDAAVALAQVLALAAFILGAACGGLGR